MVRQGRDSSMGHLPAPSQGKQWPSSRWDLVRKAREGQGADKKNAIDFLISIYYRPVYHFFQRVLNIHGDRLKDVAQDFFTRFVEKDFLKNVHEEKSFRNFLKVACRRHYINWWEAERARQPRGDRRQHGMHDGDGTPIDVPIAEDRFAEMIDHELRTQFLQDAVRILQERLVKEKKEVYFQVFEARVRFDGEKPTEYAQIAKETGLSVFDVRNYLTYARKIFREALRGSAQDRNGDPESELRDLDLLKYLS